MTPNEFCYWLQGRAELLPDQPPTDAEWKMIREHLALVFTKVTPPIQRRDPSYEEVQKALRKVPGINEWHPNFPPGGLTATC